MNKPLNTRSAMRAGRVAMPNGTAIAEFDLYLDAVKTVDQMVEKGFPAPMIAIVGSDLHTVERLRGRMSYAVVAFRGAITGSWIGLFYSLLFTSAPSADATVGSIGSSFAASVFIGAGLGMLVNVIRFSISRNRKSFMSSSLVIASKYEVVVPHELADKARELL